MKRVLLRTGRWIAISTVGFAVVALGIVLLFTPGPGLVVIAAGVMILSVEFRWARRLRDRMQATVLGWRDRARLRRLRGRLDPAAPPADEPGQKGRAA